MALLQGITIKLYERIATGTDAFNAPTFSDIAVDVNNVLVLPSGADPVTEDVQLRGKRLTYKLCIPKDDNHIWENRTVEFFGEKWQVVGLPEMWISELVPLGWNKRVQVERYE